jgi:hypothetical protein
MIRWARSTTMTSRIAQGETRDAATTARADHDRFSTTL